MKELTLEITNKCYENCPWCSSCSSKNGNHLETEKIKDILRAYRSICNTVRLSGGEPTLHPNIFQIIALAKILSYKTILLTNGQNWVLGPDLADEYYVHIINKNSIQTALILKNLRPITMQVVLAKGNEKWLTEAIIASLFYDIPVRFLTLQKQGRGFDCNPLKLITMTGDRGCDKDNKITITHDGKVVSCSALKYGECSLNP